MSEPNGAPTPVVAPIPALIPVPGAAPAASATPAPSPDEPPAVDPKWLAPRLDRAAKQRLADLGFKDEEDAKAALEARRVAEEAKKTTEQKLLEAGQRTSKLERQLTERDALIANMATAKLAALSEAHRAVIEELAGKDPLLQLNMIEKLAPTWTAQGAPPAAASPTTPRPAQTAAPAPPAPAPGAPKNDFEKWNDLRAKDPVGASLFYQMNSMRIEQSRRT
jgi:hypothetical protein